MPKCPKGCVQTGYALTYQHYGDDPEFGGESYRIRVEYQGAEVGGTLVRVGEDGWEPSMTEVLPAHRRKGLATAMYQLAEELIGEPLSPNTDQSDDARALWDSF